MGKKMISRTEDFIVDCCRVSEAVVLLNELSDKCGADSLIEIDGGISWVSYSSEETDKEYNYRTSRQENQKNAVEKMERSQLAALIERYGADGGIK